MIHWTYSSRGGNTSARTDLIPNLMSDSCRQAGESRQSGNWVVGVTVRAWSIKGGTLVSVQRDAVSDAQWQIRLASKASQDSTQPAEAHGRRKLTLEM